MINYLVRVMKAMNFPKTFTDWILMLHEGATTRFILKFLTDPIKILFSIRQGDPLSMLLYIIYIEPLLMMIRRMTRGLTLSSNQQKDEDYCDDINFIGEKISDIVVIEEVFTNFESFSGAILSRSNKSKVMGLGSWRGRQDWPLDWLQVVKVMKIFGFQISPAYKQTLELSWDACMTGFRKTIMSWKARQLDSLLQRVEVLRIFATSKLWYKASALPLPLKFAKKFESMMGTFLWMGRLERLQIDEIKNSCSSGGLGLPCVSSKADSLFLKQTCRLLMNPETNQYRHLKYWMGLHLRDYFPDMAAGPHSELVSPYFQSMRMLLTEALVLGDFAVGALRSVTAKAFYQGFTTSFPPPKVVYKYDIDWSLVWKRLEYLVLEPSSRDVLFSIIHNIVPNKERLFTRMHIGNSPNCLLCGMMETNTHIFTECVMVREAWGWVRMRLLDLLSPESSMCSNFEMIHLMFENHFMDMEAVW